LRTVGLADDGGNAISFGIDGLTDLTRIGGGHVVQDLLEAFPLEQRR